MTEQRERCEHGLEVCPGGVFHEHSQLPGEKTAKCRGNIRHHTDYSYCIPAKEEAMFTQAETDALLAGVKPVCSTCGSTDGVPLMRDAVGWHKRVARCECEPIPCQPCPACSAKPKPEAAGVMTREKLLGERKRAGQDHILSIHRLDYIEVIDAALSLYDRAEAAERKHGEIHQILAGESCRIIKGQMLQAPTFRCTMCMVEWTYPAEAPHSDGCPLVRLAPNKGITNA